LPALGFITIIITLYLSRHENSAIVKSHIISEVRRVFQRYLMMDFDVYRGVKCGF
jgi:hypothetical protein